MKSSLNPEGRGGKRHNSNTLHSQAWIGSLRSHEQVISPKSLAGAQRVQAGQISVFGGEEMDM